VLVSSLLSRLWQSLYLHDRHRLFRGVKSTDDEFGGQSAGWNVPASVERMPDASLRRAVPLIRCVALGKGANCDFTNQRLCLATRRWCWKDKDLGVI